MRMEMETSVHPEPRGWLCRELKGHKTQWISFIEMVFYASRRDNSPSPVGHTLSLTHFVFQDMQNK
jgi:hypothetical protein